MTKRSRPKFPEGYQTERKQSERERLVQTGTRFANAWMRAKIAITVKMESLGVPKEEIHEAIEGLRAGDFDAFNNMIDKIRGQ